MTTVLMAVTASDHWTFADGSTHTTGYWPEEVAAPHRIFVEAGFTVTIATPGGRRPVADEAGFLPVYNGGSEQAAEEIRSYLASISAELDGAVPLEGVDTADYDLVFVPGGHGPMEDLAVSESFGTTLNGFLAAGKPIAAVCHGSAALLPARRDDGSWAFAGYEVTGFSNNEEQLVGFAPKAAWLLEDRLTADGGKFTATDEAWAPKVVSDRTLHTGQNPASSEPLARKLVEVLSG
jgi:putative intracellular protease/amidase